MARWWRWSGALMTTALATGLVAEPSAAKVTFAGIGAVKLDMAEADVRGALGRPTGTRNLRDRNATALHYRSLKIEVTIESGSGRVVAVKTRSRGQRTASGLGVGSRTADVRRKLRGEKCGAASGVVACSIERNGAVIDFEIRRGKVVRVGVTRATTR